ncbi:MAG: TlpA family protein disulfide reductase [Gammaproteobacteria bacterium]|nr:MAG: TlpA family protein disulfide reductase [Gammaproteobacteria bacterium]
MTKINQTCPELMIETWVQGGPLTLADLHGKVVLVEVIQVNCPGCFVNGLPEAIRLYQKYNDQGLEVIALATAFEDYDKNTLENLQRLIDTGEVIGETSSFMEERGLLKDGKLMWEIPFPVAMDSVAEDDRPVDDNRVLTTAQQHLPDFDTRREEEKTFTLRLVRQYLEHKKMRANTFELFSLKGTPSSILIDREGILRDVSFGLADHLEPKIQKYLRG